MFSLLIKSNPWLTTDMVGETGMVDNFDVLLTTVTDQTGQQCKLS